MLQIYGTLGPACRDENILRRMFEAGMTGIRLNLSHTMLSQAEEQIEAVFSAAESLGVKPELLIDMQGPELRIGALAEPIAIDEGMRVTLGAEGIEVPLPVLEALQPGQEVLLDDGKIALRVTESGGEQAHAEALRGGLLSGRKSIALPGITLQVPTMTESDRENIALAERYGVTGVMQPFVRGREDLAAVRSALDAAGAEHVRLFAKIENMQGVHALPELVDSCDEIVIARGDLGNAMPLWQLPAEQKNISALCREKGRAFMVVTQMLASMEKNPVPTRAEVSDIFNAVLDGASSLMVTGETAVGKYPVEAIRYMKNTADEAARFLGQG